MIIGVAGFAGSGKGTVSDFLLSPEFEIGIGRFQKLSFADAVKDATTAIFGWPRELLEGDTEESRKFREKEDEWWTERLGFSVTPRWAMQRVGTEGGRDALHKDIWIHALTRRVENSLVPHFVVPDVRFPNEFKAIRDLGGAVWRVRRGNEPEFWTTAKYENHARAMGLDEHEYASQMAKFFPDVHISEWAWIGQDFDAIIENDGTKDDLENKVVALVKEVMNETV